MKALFSGQGPCRLLPLADKACTDARPSAGFEGQLPASPAAFTTIGGRSTDTWLPKVTGCLPKVMGTVNPGSLRPQSLCSQ